MNIKISETNQLSLENDINIKIEIQLPKNMFEYTRESYVKAVEYLTKIGKIFLVEKEQSINGYTVVALANKLKYAEIILSVDKAKNVLAE